MNYQKTLDFLFNQLPMYQRIGKAAYKANLDNTLALDKYFKHPHTNYKTIHVAGTNGKGSVSSMIASVLQEAGYKVGLYTSPHLLDFRERIKINGNLISKQWITNFVEKNWSFIQKINPSFFEITVAIAFQYFSDEEVDIAVIEVGMGGRLDSTNIIEPEISIITNIGFDHMTFLGDNLEKIAFEKAGIFKNNTPIIIGETQKRLKHIFQESAAKMSSKIIFADALYKINSDPNTGNYKQVFRINTNYKTGFEKLEIDLLGNYQKKNVCTSLCALTELKNNGLILSDQHFRDGFKNVIENTGLMGRWQILKTKPLIVCDTGHNQDGIKQVIQQINKTHYRNLHIIFGMVNDKIIDSILKLLPKNAIYYFTRAKIPRALDEKILFEQAKQHKLEGKVFDNVEKALSEAIKIAKKEDMIYIGGSTFIVADALDIFIKN